MVTKNATKGRSSHKATLDSAGADAVAEEEPRGEAKVGNTT